MLAGEEHHTLAAKTKGVEAYWAGIAVDEKGKVITAVSEVHLDGLLVSKRSPPAVL